MKRRFPAAAAAAWLVTALFPLASCKPSKMDAETIAYAKSFIRFPSVHLSAKDAYAGQTVYFLRIEVANSGSRAVKELDVVLYFYDTAGNLVTTERATAVSPRLRPLGSGEKRDFVHGFYLPDGWNRTSPNIGIAYLELK